jgi:hypothetical protein
MVNNFIKRRLASRVRMRGQLSVISSVSFGLYCGFRLRWSRRGRSRVDIGLRSFGIEAPQPVYRVCEW